MLSPIQLIAAERAFKKKKTNQFKYTSTYNKLSFLPPLYVTATETQVPLRTFSSLWEK